MTAATDQDAAAGGAAPVRGAGVVLGLLMATTALGISAPAVALPALASDLGQPVPALAWLLAAYALALAVATALAGRVVDLVGPHRTLAAGVGLAVLGSAVALLGPSVGVVVLGRAVQGAGAGAIAVVVLAVATQRPPQQRGAVLGAMTGTVAVISGAGPLLGGALAEVAPRLALALPALALLVARPALRGVARTSAPFRVDLVGAGLLTAAVVGLLLVVQARTTRLPLPLALSIGVVALTAGAALVRHTRRTPDGFLPRDVLGRPGFGFVVGAGATVMAAYLAVLFTAPVLLAAEGYGPLRTGAVLLPAAVAGALVSRVIGRLIARTAPLVVVSGVAVLASGGLAVGALLGGTAPGVVVATAMVLAAFTGGQVAIVAAMTALVPDAVRGLALGLQNLGLLAGGALGTAVAGAVTDLGSPRVALAVLVPVPLVGLLLAVAAQRRVPAPRPEEGSRPR